MPKHARPKGQNQEVESRIQVDDPHMKGYCEARSEGMAELADVLRIRVQQPLETGELLSQPMAREIFTALFGTYECDREFGPETHAPIPDVVPVVDTGDINACLEEGARSSVA